MTQPPPGYDERSVSGSPAGFPPSGYNGPQQPAGYGAPQSGGHGGPGLPGGHGGPPQPPAGHNGPPGPGTNGSQSAAYGSQQVPPTASSRPPLPVLLALAAAGLALLNTLWGFFESSSLQAAGQREIPLGTVFHVVGWAPALLLLSGLVAASTLLPTVSKTTAWMLSAAAAFTGGIGALFYLMARAGTDGGIGFLIAGGSSDYQDNASIGLVLLVIFGLLQIVVTLAGLAAVLAPQQRVRRPRPPRPATPPAGPGQGYQGSSGQPGPPAGSGGAQPYPPQYAPAYQPGQYAPSQQPEQYAPSQQPAEQWPQPQYARSQPEQYQPQQYQPQEYQPQEYQPQEYQPQEFQPAPHAPEQYQQPPQQFALRPDRYEQPVYDPQVGREVYSGLSAAPTGPVPTFPPPADAPSPAYPPVAEVAAPEQYARTDFGSADYVWEPTYSEAPDYEAKAAEDEADDAPAEASTPQNFVYETPERPQYEPPRLDSGRHEGWDSGYSQDTMGEASQPGTQPPVDGQKYRPIPRAE